jgi:hypothetical protein
VGRFAFPVFSLTEAERGRSVQGRKGLQRRVMAFNFWGRNLGLSLTCKMCVGNTTPYWQGDPLRVPVASPRQAEGSSVEPYRFPKGALMQTHGFACGPGWRKRQAQRPRGMANANPDSRFLPRLRRVALATCWILSPSGGEAKRGSFLCPPAARGAASVRKMWKTARRGFYL